MPSQERNCEAIKNLKKISKKLFKITTTRSAELIDLPIMTEEWFKCNKKYNFCFK